VNPIIHMNHSPRLAEHGGPPLPRERDSNRLFQELIGVCGSAQAARLARSLESLSYDRLCAAFVTALSDADFRTIHTQETE